MYICAVCYENPKKDSALKGVIFCTEHQHIIMCHDGLLNACKMVANELERSIKIVESFFCGVKTATEVVLREQELGKYHRLLVPLQKVIADAEVLS